MTLWYIITFIMKNINSVYVVYWRVMTVCMAQICNDGVSGGKLSGFENFPCYSCSENGRHYPR